MPFLCVIFPLLGVLDFPRNSDTWDERRVARAYLSGGWIAPQGHTASGPTPVAAGRQAGASTWVWVAARTFGTRTLLYEMYLLTSAGIQEQPGQALADAQILEAQVRAQGGALRKR